MKTLASFVENQRSGNHVLTAFSAHIMFYPQKSHSEQRENDSEAIAYTRLFSSGDSALQIIIIKYKLPHDRNACDHTMSRSDFSKAC